MSYQITEFNIPDLERQLSPNLEIELIYEVGTNKKIEKYDKLLFIRLEKCKYEACSKEHCKLQLFATVRNENNYQERYCLDTDLRAIVISGGTINKIMEVE